jgi:hypothetical protein
MHLPSRRPQEKKRWVATVPMFRTLGGVDSIMDCIGGLLAPLSVDPVGAFVTTYT